MIQGILAHCLRGCLPWPHCAIPSPPCQPPLLTPDWEIAGESEVLWVMEEGTASGSQTHHPLRAPDPDGQGQEEHTRAGSAPPYPAAMMPCPRSLSGASPELQPATGAWEKLPHPPVAAPVTSPFPEFRHEGQICEAPSSRATL